MITEFKIFEKKRKSNEPYKSPSSRRKEAIDKSNKYKQFVSGAYIVFRYSNEEMVQNLRKNMMINNNTFDDSVILARILGIHESPYDERYQTVVYLEAQPIEFMIFNSIRNIQEMNKVKEFNMTFISNIYISTSISEAKEKYNELVKDTEIKYDAQKYNL